jgi:hypothetical protein
MKKHAQPELNPHTRKRTLERERESARDPRSLTIAEKGIKTGNDFANLMSALMSDLIEGRVTPSIGNATCNAGGKLLKVVEMQYRYGTKGSTGNDSKVLVLALEQPVVMAADPA